VTGFQVASVHSIALWSAIDELYNYYVAPRNDPLERIPKTSLAGLGRVAKAARKPVSMTWPSPVYDHLRSLAGIADATGESTSESEIAAALIATTAPATGEELGVLLRRYRTMTLQELDHSRPAEIVGLDERRRRGRPRRAG